MRRRCSVAAMVTLMVFSVRTVHAQGALLNETTWYDVLSGTGSGTSHGPLRAIILWRGEAGWRQPAGAARTRADSVFRWGRLRAEEAGTYFFGSGVAYGVIAHDRNAVTIEGRSFDIAREDSALVVMVAVPAGDQPRVVSSARIARSALPTEFWGRTWFNGDTTFFLHPSLEKQNALMRAALESSPVVRAFLQ